MSSFRISYPPFYLLKILRRELRISIQRTYNTPSYSISIETRQTFERTLSTTISVQFYICAF